MKKAYFITGTDTGVGKTLVACALLRAFVKQGSKAVGMKPVAAGCAATVSGLRCDDVDRLVAAGNVSAPPEWINPYALAPSVAPHIAAEQAGLEIRLDIVEQAFRKLAARADVVVVEGAGGFMVPLNAREGTADLAQCLGLPVILVVSLRLGCLNHALLTALAVKYSGLRLAGWVANQIEPEMDALQENILALQNRLQAPLIGILPCFDHPSAEDASGLLAIEMLV